MYGLIIYKIIEPNKCLLCFLHLEFTILIKYETISTYDMLK